MNVTKYLSRFGKTRPYLYMRPVRRSYTGIAFIGSACIAFIVGVAVINYSQTFRRTLAEQPGRLRISIAKTFRIPVAIADNNTASNIKLQHAIEEAMVVNGARDWGITVYDLGSDEWMADIGGDKQMTAASLYKLYVVYGLSKKLSFEEWSSKQVAGRSVKSCVDLMLRISHNPCGVALGTYVGWENIDRSVKEYGFKYTELNRKNDENIVTSSKDTTKFMKDLYYGKLLEQPAKDFVLDSLSRQLYTAGIPAGCKSCKIWNKTGDTIGVMHDSAIVQSGQRTYVVTIMSRGGTMKQIANIQRAIEKSL